MSTLTDIRKGFEIIGDGTYSAGRDLARRGTDFEMDLLTVAEIGSLASSLGEWPATVYAAAIMGNGNPNDLAHDLTRLGPWSWALDMWFSPEARDIVSTLDMHPQWVDTYAHLMEV